MKITLLGAGAWGTALATALAGRHDVLLWGRDQQAMHQTAILRENQSYLPGIKLPAELQITADFDAAMLHCQDDAKAQDKLLIAATSVAGLEPLALRLQDFALPNLVWLCKGLSEQSHLLPHQIIAKIFNSELAAGALSGPSFAQEIALGLPGALVIASENVLLRQQVVQAVHGPQLRVYSTDDVIGVEVGGAVKNILAIATGIIDGLGLGLNARAALMTRGLAEITRLGIALGGRAETFMGLTGMGDLILTCTGDLSRNRQVGLALSQGKKLDAIVRELGHVAEGVRCAQAVCSLAAKYQVEMPIANAVAAVLFDGDLPKELVKKLLSREARDEN